MRSLGQLFFLFKFYSNIEILRRNVCPHFHAFSIINRQPSLNVNNLDIFFNFLNISGVFTSSFLPFNSFLQQFNIRLLPTIFVIRRWQLNTKIGESNSKDLYLDNRIPGIYNSKGSDCRPIPQGSTEGRIYVRTYVIL